MGPGVPSAPEGSVGAMADDRVERVAAVLRQAAETHHAVYAIVDGDDPDWATWYADWLVNLSPLGEILGTTPVRSAVTALLVRAAAAPADGPWDVAYARAIVAELG